MPTSEELADIIGDVVGSNTPEGQKLLAAIELPTQRSVLHLYRAEEDGRIHFESESGNHVAMTAERWAELGEPNAITIGIWAGVL